MDQEQEEVTHDFHLDAGLLLRDDSRDKIRWYDSCDVKIACVLDLLRERVELEARLFG
jgi:hypothetical protein